MGKTTLSNVKLWYGQYDLSTDFNECSVDIATAAVQAPAFGDSTKIVYPGLDESRIGAAGFYDADAPGVMADPVLQAAVGVAGPLLTVAPLTGAEGERCYFMQSLASEYDPYAGVAVGGMAKFKFAAAAASRMPQGTILRNVAAAGDTVTGNGSIFQMGAIPTGQSLWGGIHIFGVTGGTPSLTVAIQSAAAIGFGSPTTRFTFSAQVAAGWVWLSPQVAGPITDQYWRCTFTISGSTPNFKYAVVAGIV